MSSTYLKSLILTIAFGSVALAQSSETPISTSIRLRWLANENVSPTAVLWDFTVAGEETLTNSPKEYGPHWVGYGKRVGITAANYGVKSTMEAGLGAIWGEDPRYDRTEGKPFLHRLGHAIEMGFMAHDSDGHLMFAYARAASFAGGNFLETTWMPDSQASAHDAIGNIGLNYLGRMAGNAFKEFRPRH